MDRKWRANVDPAPNCPRCASSNTKFCYYNNYSLSQPRFFCKGCSRYWTKGGSLRRIPVGGGCRKRSRSRSTKVCNLEEHPSSACSENSVGADIDMAAVFAKFLNNEQGNISQEITEVENTSSEDSRNSLTSSSAGMEYSNGFDPQIFSDNFLVPDQNQFQAKGAIEGFINPDFASFDDIIKDVFWSNDSNISSLTCQPAAQAQAEGVLDLTLLPADQYDIRPDPIPTDNCDFFDDLEFEVLSPPWKFSQYS